MTRRYNRKNLNYEDLDFTKLRYVLYARKSTTDESKQEYSIPDQVKYCQEYAKKNNLHIVKVIKESQSAKVANKRPLFKQMLKDIKAGKYDGILAWHPDRLCRNMLEAGVLIDMLDNWDIIDLKFCQHSFENNASGKMMLGMMFVFSKQYSDSLSERVKRGIDGNIDRGFTNGAPKWGYTRELDTKKYVPDENFDLIRKGWDMRLDGKSCKEIWAYFKKQGIKRYTNRSKKAQTMKSPTSVENIFKDSFYYGLAIQADTPIHLCEKYDFKPMVTEDEYNQVQALCYKENKKYNRIRQSKPGDIFKPLENFVICETCKKPMSVCRHMPRDKSGRILYFDCRNQKCKRKEHGATKGVMAGVVFEQIYELFDAMQFDETAYEAYSKQLASMTDDKINGIKTEIASKKGAIKSHKQEIAREGDKIGKTSSETLIKQCNEHIDELEVEINVLENEVRELEEKIKNPADLKLDQQDFVNLMKSLGNKMRAADIIRKDKIARKVFVNLYLDEQNRLHYLLREPFNSVISIDENQCGRAGWNRTSIVSLEGISPIR